MIQKQKVIAIAGPTASGKSKYAIELAKKLNGEIISADSRLVYKGFDVACAKPTREELLEVKHHLIDVVEPEVDYSVANFYDDAKVAIKEIIKRGKIPIVAGGTGLYFRILLENYDLPRVEPNYELRNELEQLSCEELYKKLLDLDKVSAEKIHANNKIKIIRALEVCLSLDKPMSEVAGIKESEYDVEWIGLCPDREVLYNRINKRVDEMLKDGLVEETERLLMQHGRIKNIVKTIGYQEIIRYLDDEITLDEALDEIKLNTRHYAKRQITWFRRNKELKII